ncbi:MviN-like protein [Bifidobacterium lemurum]|uniref:MviN-like protein n=1 Tax=Bifidobacterium lemurum TaxID=1603886 RepID=A0A261FL75_9BIFI|nr:murein biosynthesis integral membrane protein MurJ [Bifidobacterium lemurum]OZG59755.1 MviN-like protein [Bifidobacterium lemurum]QOL35046.1 murein biosynthesis integral membrane protein MurJ [Bifidobacterium lemurum]
MSSSVGRNSLIMASGTAASRVTGQLRTILLAAAMGTTGLAANAYQAGTMIPQAVFTLISGGIFNAVLVPQIVRTLKERDAEERLNKLITLAITLLLGITLLMAVATPLLTRLYVSGGEDMLALTTAFTLWCMPQIFFYGLYTVLGQILAAKNHFATYAWSSVGANVISCAGFTAFILLFGKANEQPLDFWTADKVTMTAGVWTLGVAFQALVLFIPLRRAGIRYRPSWGVHGIGLRAMGPVAAWSFAIVIVDQITTMVNTRIMSSAPAAAHEATGISLYDVAGNATYQNAFTIYILPYSLIAVSVSTAVFPKISAAIAERRLDSARTDLSYSLRSVGVLMLFFTTAFAVMPAPITLVLLPSISVKEALLIASPLMTLGFALPITGAFIIIQRTFYAFEDGRSPFLFQTLYSVIQLTIILLATTFVDPTRWVWCFALSVVISYLMAFPLLVIRLRKRFGGTMDGRRIAMTYGKAALAAAVAIVAGRLVSGPAQSLLGVRLNADDGTMNWFQAVGLCVLLTIVITVAYVGVLWLTRSEELLGIVDMVMGKLGRRRATGDVDDTASEAGEAAPNDDALSTDEAAPTVVPSTPVVPAATDGGNGDGDATPDTSHSGDLPPQTASPTAKMTPAMPQGPAEHHITESKNTMKPQLGDTIIGRYTLVSLLRDEPGVQAWRANDRMLAQDCQLFIVTDGTSLQAVNTIASGMAALQHRQYVRVLQLHQNIQSSLIVTKLDEGISLSDYMRLDRQPLSHAAIRSILGELIQAARPLVSAGVPAIRLTTDTVRLTSAGLQLADAPLAPMIADPSAALTASGEADSFDMTVTSATAIHQIAALLVAMLTRTPSDQCTAEMVRDLSWDIPGEFRLIVRRGLSTQDIDANELAMESFAELDALLGEWTPLHELDERDIVLPLSDSGCSIQQVPLKPVDPESIHELSESMISTERMPDLSIDTMSTSFGAADSDDSRPDVLAKPKAFAQNHGFSSWDFTLGTQETSDDWYPEFNDSTSPATVADGAQLTVPIAIGGMDDTALITPTSAVESTSRIPVIGEDGQPKPMVPMSTAQLELEEEQRRSQAAIATPTPPSFTPTQQPEQPDTPDDEPLADERLFGRLTTKLVVVIVCAVLIIAAAFLAVRALQPEPNTGGIVDDTSDSSSSNWPEMDLEKVPFGDSSTSQGDGDTADSSDTGDQTSNSADDSDGADDANADTDADTDSDQDGTTGSTTPITADREVGAVPQPRHENNTAFTISSQEFLTNPAGQQGFAFHMHLDQPQDTYRMTITIRSSGGRGYIIANSDSDPTQGEQVADFTFAEGGTTEVRFTKVVNTQDLLLWVPMDSLPDNQLYIERVEVF